MVGFNILQNSGKWLDFSVKINQKTFKDTSVRN